MEVLNPRFGIAVDTVASDEEEQPVQIPKRLIRFIQKTKDELGIKLVIYHDKGQQPNDIINQEVIDQLGSSVEFVNSQSMLLFRLGYYIGQGLHTLFYSSSRDNHCFWIRENLGLDSDKINTSKLKNTPEVKILK